MNKVREKHSAVASVTSHLSGNDHLKTITEVNVMFPRMVLIFKLRSINGNTNSGRKLFN